MKKFSDLKIGDKIYIFYFLDGISKPNTILGITTLPSGGLVFNTVEEEYERECLIFVNEENVVKSISIFENFSIYINPVITITDPKIAEWFDL